MATFFSRLSYSFGNEDWRTEQQALKIQPQDSVVCITGSGDRPLNLLMSDCKEIVCLDANQIQNHLLNLKGVAMQELDFDDYLSFLGATPAHQKRIDQLQKIQKTLHPEAAQFWLKNPKLIEKGILYQGAVERWVGRGAVFFSLFKKSKIEKLFQMDDLEEQRAFVQKHWDCPTLKLTFQFALNRWFTQFFLSDPGLNDHVAESIHPGSYIYGRMNESLHRYLAKESLLLSLILTGRVQPAAFPAYLTPTGTQTIKNRLDRLKPKIANIVQYLESVEEPQFDCFSVSDVVSYLNEKDFIRLLRGIQKAAKPGARFCMRQFLSYYDIPPDLKSIFVRDRQLEQRLEQEDTCFVYRFMAGTVNK